MRLVLLKREGVQLAVAATERQRFEAAAGQSICLGNQGGLVKLEIVVPRRDWEPDRAFQN